jgi:hypothetical protein
MTTLPASVPKSQGSGGVVVCALIALAGILSSCAGPTTTRTDDRTTIKTPPGHIVTVMVTKDETRVETRPVPIWESIVSGVTGGLVNAFKPRAEP